MPSQPRAHAWPADEFSVIAEGVHIAAVCFGHNTDKNSTKHRRFWLSCSRGAVIGFDY